MPGESPATLGDALRRLSAAATYLYQDAARYCYSTQPTVTKMAEDLAEQYKAQLRPRGDSAVRPVERKRLLATVIWMGTHRTLCKWPTG
jgi:hypothetical protein